MKCPYCTSKNIRHRQQATNLGYDAYRCCACQRQFNERTGTVYNFLTHRTEVVVDAAADAFFQQCFKTTSVTPKQITTDKEAALANGIESVFNGEVKHRTSKYMNNRIEQDHRGIKVKGRLKHMRGFKNIFSALVFCTVFEEIRQHFSMKGKTRAKRRSLLASKFKKFNKIVNLAA